MICISKSKCKKTVTAIIVIGRYCLYVPTKRKAYHGCSIRVSTEEDIKRTGHSTPAVRAISELGAHQHYSAISDVCIRYVYTYVYLYKKWDLVNVYKC